MSEDFENELIPTNEITPFDSAEDISEKIKQKYFTIKKQNLDKRICEKCLSGKPNPYCPFYSKCPYVKESTGNTIINKFKDFTELVFYRSNFHIPSGTNVSKNVDKTRKWIKDENGLLLPINDNVKLEDLQRTIFDSRKRSLDNAFGFILCNDWNYFVTVTFKHGKHKKLSDEVVKYQWKKFRQQLQYRFPDIKIILFPEDTPTGVKGMHFHGFFGNCDGLGDYLRPARNNKKIYNGKDNVQYGEFLYTEYGDPIFNIVPSFVNIGFSTVVKIKDNSNKLKLINYMTKYMTKDSSNYDYNENAYLRTYNLDFKEKEVAMFSEEEKNKLVNSLFAVCYKETDTMTVYRIFKDKTYLET